jgi:hypothetical protein
VCRPIQLLLSTNMSMLSWNSFRLRRPQIHNPMKSEISVTWRKIRHFCIAPLPFFALHNYVRVLAHTTRSFGYTKAWLANASRADTVDDTRGLICVEVFAWRSEIVQDDERRVHWSEVTGGSMCDCLSYPCPSTSRQFQALLHSKWRPHYRPSLVHVPPINLHIENK